ncbi:MAG: YbaB/EbfC family nucleoid-associated protein [Armatimonadetes bacterium]|nr:YbaB/EbfC family nucleoid-associated protein [Armatimonadota bacterium]
MSKQFGGMGGLNQLMKQAQKAAEQIQKIQDQLAEERIEASSGGGMVTAVVTGDGHLMEIRISPDAVDPDDVEMLQDLVVTAVREGLEQSEKLRESRLKSVTGGMGLPGMNMPGLF